MSKASHALAAAAILAVSAWALPATAQEGIEIPAPVVDVAQSAARAGQTEVAVLAGGCFWGVQAIFQHTKGVLNAVSGYAGGEADTASYNQITSGRTGHAEAVQITYDPARITYGELLHIFYSVAHDPTQLNYQGPDHGTQYRTAIFPQNDEQAKVAEAYIDQLDAAKVFEKPIVTTIEAGKPFYAAEDYHQDYLVENPTWPYIVYYDLPKLENMKRIFPARYTDKPVLVKQAASRS